MLSKKEQRYDRQLRIWKDHGQRQLETSSVLVLGSDTAACEVLKNLVLPGVGSFAIVDPTLVSANDLGNNFFIDCEADFIGRVSRAEAVLSNLSELNGNVRGRVLSTPLSDIAQVVSTFDIVIVTMEECHLPAEIFGEIATVCWNKSIPLLKLQLNGLFAQLRLQVPQVLVAETHAEFTLDLRFDCPWPELEQHAKDQLEKLSSLTAYDLGHIPAILLLLCATTATKVVEERQAVPQVRQRVRQWLGEQECGQSLENFAEANRLLNRWKYYELPANVSRVFDDPKCANLQRSFDTGSDEWLIVWAVKQFYLDTGTLPLMGKIPDLKADTQSFVYLESLYRQKAERDFTAVKKIVHDKNPNVCKDLILRYCTNALNLTVKNFTSFSKESTRLAPSLLRAFASEADPQISLHLLFNAESLFYRKYQRFPGQHLRFDYTRDVVLFSKVVEEMLASFDLKIEWVHDGLLQEFVRASKSRLCTIASLIGGVASQEALKLLTKQFVPMSDLYIFNGVTCSSVEHCLST